MSVIEKLKRMNLVNFLERVYGVEFRREGKVHVALSPFREETRPSFYVREERDGHWVFKDHGCGAGGTVFDFVAAYEGLGSFGEALGRVCRLTGLTSASSGSVPVCIAGPSENDGRWKKNDERIERDETEVKGGYDIEGLYERFRNEDATECGEYLVGRGIDEGLVSDLLRDGTVVLNQFERGRFCCFTVRDRSGGLRCLYNRQMDGEGKFVLGPKAPFTLDWSILGRSETVFLCEGVVDYLSVKTLESRDIPGLALLGNALNVDAELIPSCRKIVAAFDGDQGGFSALYDVLEGFPELTVEPYDLEGCKDPNEFLRAKRAGRARELSGEEKLKLYREFVASENKAEVAREWQLTRSYAYEIAGECEDAIVAEFSSRRRGRPRKEEIGDLAAARKRIEELEEKNEEEARERERLHCRSEFLKLRLKWAEIDVAEARGEKVDLSAPEVRKRHAKKKRRKRR